MGNCVARDLGFETESLEKNKMLMRKMQEKINHKRTMDQSLGLHLDKSDEDDSSDSDSDDSLSAEKEALTERKSKKTSSGFEEKSVSQGNEQESLVLSIMMPGSYNNIKNLDNCLMDALVDSTIALTPIRKAHEDNSNQLGELSSYDEEKEIVLSAKGLEYHSIKNKDQSQALNKISKSENGSLDSLKRKDVTTIRSADEKSDPHQKDAKESRVNRFQESKSFDIAKSKNLAGSEGNTSMDEKKKSQFYKNKENSTEQGRKIEPSKELLNKSNQSNQSKMSNNTQKTNNSQTVCTNEEPEYREQQVYFDNRFYKDDITSKLRERTPSLAPRDQKIFTDEYETENTDND